MAGRIKAVFNWSGGKDSAHALYRVMKEGRYEIVALLTTVNRDNGRSSMHDIPVGLLKLQAESIGIPLHVVELTPEGSMDDYGREMGRAAGYFAGLGVRHFVFGDIFLKDVRRYREESLGKTGITVVEPLWGMPTEKAMEEFLLTGLKSVVVTASDGLGSGFLGKTIDREFVSSLPEGTDPNGENGEYHSFCYDGPIFGSAVPYSLGEPQRESFRISADNGETVSFSFWFARLLDG